ncbi:hypothetical protein HNR37_002010 [Desulfurispira natronophila]|uniref:Uncharacterized protein n=1 Tax=Desulfurispira natronophila TaxID=682562 RepID=A0A7W7Y5W7_9BACT|nr:hypothetical protein [Desulfurispira natronophila]
MNHVTIYLLMASLLGAFILTVASYATASFLY